MAQEAALFYTDAQGITGDNRIEARADSSEVIEVHHEVRKPTDIQSGLSTGRRVHGALRILKRIDKASPLLSQALCNNQPLASLELKWYRPSPATGEIEHFYTIKLTDAFVASTATWLPNTLEPRAEFYTPMEWIEFTYQKIEWTFEDGGITFEDAWTGSAV